jgi:hypothetical protein
MNAFPGEAVDHENYDRARLGRGFASHDHDRDDHRARSASACEATDPI